MRLTKISKLLILTLTVSLGLVGCGSPQTVNQDEAAYVPGTYLDYVTEEYVTELPAATANIKEEGFVTIVVGADLITYHNLYSVEDIAAFLDGTEQSEVTLKDGLVYVKVTDAGYATLLANLTAHITQVTDTLKAVDGVESVVFADNIFTLTTKEGTRNTVITISNEFDKLMVINAFFNAVSEKEPASRAVIITKDKTHYLQYAAIKN